MSEVVQRRIDDGVALLTLNRPDRLNAWTPEMGRTYFDLLEDCAGRDDVRVIVVTGAGRGFCAGADMDNLQALGTDGAEARGGERDERPQTFPLTIPKPIIAAVNGGCAGIGLVLALMCDIRFAAEGAKLTTAFSRRGLVAEYGIAWILPRLVGPARALDLLLSGRVVLGEEAAALGLVNRSLPADRLLDETLAYARDLAANTSPSSMAAMKAQVYADLERPLAEALADADRRMLASFGADDFREGVASFIERRAPRFAPLAG
jgi:enoyl-CoA hydratase/carnithine racemase